MKRRILCNAAFRETLQNSYTISMRTPADDLLQIDNPIRLESGTLVLAFYGWMDGGDASTGTVERLRKQLDAQPFARISGDPFYVYHVPGDMEVAVRTRPHIEIEEGLVKKIEMPTNIFYGHEPSNLALFVGREPNMQWETFGECIFKLASETGISRILFVGSFGGTVPHTREPRLYITASNEQVLAEMESYGMRRSGYEGPGSFTTYLMSQAPRVGLEMGSLVAEIPGYLNVTNPASIEAVTRRLAKLLDLPVKLDPLITETTRWEFEISKVVEENENSELASQIRQWEEDYDNELLDRESDS